MLYLMSVRSIANSTIFAAMSNKILDLIDK